ncbi:LamG-like jellyroll fold domain-containing protein [Rugamonas sp.]|uniref:LamG-like jellyroll fold domain-containing protein n=1 Tax=Rugamonas sp. TaxID=1926287 RepID=UPI0025DAC1A2|nr:LamG-like jellyroll fold domain-containing protein [Rugamonas sp.]
MLALACGFAGSAAAADHLYQLNGNLDDSDGGPALVASGGTVGASAYSFAANQGLTMGVSLGSVYTIDMNFHFDALSGYQKVIDFSALASDAGMYVLGSNWNFFPVQNYSATTVVAGQDARLTITRDAASTVNLYVNGAAFGTFNDSTGLADFGANNAVFFIDDAHTGGREAGAGSVDYIRTYDRALTADQVGTLAPVPEPANIAMLIAGLGVLAMAARRQRQQG